MVLYFRNDCYVCPYEVWKEVMATYEYICANGHPNTQVRPMTEEQTIFECEIESCASELKRVFDAAPVVFKGRGFYKTGG